METQERSCRKCGACQCVQERLYEAMAASEAVLSGVQLELCGM